MKTYHVILRTQNSEPRLPDEGAEKMKMVITRICSRKTWHLHECNVQSNHVHMLLDLKNDSYVVKLVQKLKPEVRNRLANDPVFKDFTGWQPGYSWCLVKTEMMEETRVLIKCQNVIHKEITLEEEKVWLDQNFVFVHKKGNSSARKRMYEYINSRE